MDRSHRSGRGSLHPQGLNTLLREHDRPRWITEKCRVLHLIAFMACDKLRVERAADNPKLGMIFNR